MPDPSLGDEAIPGSPGLDGLDGWRPTFPGEAPPVRGSDVMTAILPTGRVAWLQLDPVPAPVPEVNHLAQAVERMDARRAEEIREAARELHGLSRGLARGIERISARRGRAHRGLRAGLVRSVGKLDRRLGGRAAALRKAIAAQRARELELARRLGRRDLWDQLVVASSFPLFAAFGQRGSPLAERNLVLVLSLAVWLFGDEVSSLLSGSGEARAPVRDTDLWSYLAPAANVLAGWLLLHEEPRGFLAGRSELGPPVQIASGTYQCRLRVPQHLGDRAPRDGREAIPAVAGALPLVARVAAPGFTARVGRVAASADPATLELDLDAILLVDPAATPAADVAAAFPSVEVAWIVDIGGP